MFKANFFLLSSWMILALLFLSSTTTNARTIALRHMTVEMHEKDNWLGYIMDESPAVHTRAKLNGMKSVLVHVKDVTYVKELEILIGQSAVQYYPPKTLLLHMDMNELARKLRESEETVTEWIEWVGHVKPQYKTSLSFPKMKRSNMRSVSLNNTSTIDLFVILATNSMVKSQELANRVKQSLLQGYNLNSASLVHATSPKKVRVSIPSTIAGNVLEYLSNQEEVVWIERKLHRALLNTGTNIVLQSSGNINSLSYSPPSMPIWTQNITGLGEVIGVGDTGLDYDNCFFEDPSVTSIPINQIITNHRKLVGYFTVSYTLSNGTVLSSDDRDLPSGHGTHVCGTAAGGIYNGAPNASTFQLYNGVAKDAKLYFTDIQNSNYPNILLIPDDLYTSNYFTGPYVNGSARVHSNSWGCSLSAYVNCQYDCQCTWAIDWQGQTVPGQTATDSQCQQLFGTSCCQICNVYDSQAQEVDQFAYQYDEMLIVFAAGNEGTISKTGTVSSPATSKNALSVGASMSLNPSIVNDVNYYDFETYVFPQLSSYGVDSISSCCSFASSNQQEENAIWVQCCPSKMNIYYSENTIFNQSNMAYFSSRGPTTDGRIKPDVAGPGLTVASMHSDGDTTTFQCQDIRPAGNNSAALLTMQGTSMSTPGIAGAAALVRQYYKTIGGISNPTGYLVKATMIHSGQNMIGNVYVDGQSIIQNLPPTPNVYSGFGLVSLSTTLAFSNSQFQLFAFDRQNVSNGEETTYCFMSTSAMPEFKATLTWYDPPGSLGTPNILVNNLDLYVGVSSNPSASGATYYGNGNIKGDTTNNVEVAKAPNIPGSNYYISVLVTGRSVPVSPQKFALIVTGNVKQVSSCPPVNVTFVPVPSPSPPSPIFTSQSIRQYPLFIVTMAAILLSLAIAIYSF